MSFNRFRVQSAVELEIGCTDLAKWESYLAKFKDYEITEDRKTKLISELEKDASDLYFKGIFSLSDALSSLFNGRHSWATIKLYYAVFFFLRCSLASKGFAFLKNKGIYTLNMSIGEKPIRRDQTKFMGQRVTGDHNTTIATFISLFSDSDILLSNSVEGKNIYEWLMELRNQVNYRERLFTEPNNQYFFPSIFNKSKFKMQVETYLNDDVPIYCFSEEHCALAAPLKLATIVRQQLFDFIDFEPLEVCQKNEIEKLLSETKITKIKKFKKLYNFER